MSSILLTSNGINGDFEILFDDENDGGLADAGRRTVTRVVGASSTVHTTQSLYSAIADKTDEFIAMGFKNPMVPVTPNAFTLVNGYFMPRSSTEWLKEGAISADWSAGDSDEIRSIPYTVTTNFTEADKGKRVIGGTTSDTGTLLDFEKLPEDAVTWIAWVRPDTTSDTFQNASEVIEVTTDGGVGTNTSSAVSSAGTQLYSSIQAIGAVPDGSEVYIYQNRAKMTDWEGNFQWWATDPDVSLGIIDILIRVELDSTAIADGDVEVFARRYGSLYDHFRLNVSGGGRSALPLASGPDINNTTGYRTLTAENGVNVFQSGNGIYVGASWAAATKRGVLTAVSGTEADPVFEYYLVGDLTDFVNADAIVEYDFSTDADGDGDADATAAIAANDGGPTDPDAGEGGTVTVTLGHTGVDHDGNGTTESYSVEVDAQGDVSASKVYERLKYITRRGADESDLFGAGINIPGESYRGMEALIYWDAEASFAETEDVTEAGGWSATSMSLNTATTDQDVLQEFITVTDQQTSLDIIENDETITDETAGTITIDTGGAGGAIDNFTSPKSNPFGTFTGTVIFGARGVAYINPSTASPNDSQNYTLIDDVGEIRTPPNTVTILVQNTLALDKILYARDTGSAGVIDKDQFGGIVAPAGAYNDQGDVLIQVAGSIDVEVPPSAYVRIVDDSAQEEHRYRYASRTTGASGEFSLTVPTSSTGTATSNSSTTLTDTGQEFSTGLVPVEVGDLVRNTFAGKTDEVWEVTEVTDDENLAVQQLYGSTNPSDWDIGDTYEINKLIVALTTSDLVFDTIIDAEATTTSISNTLVKTPASDFGSVCNVRQGKVILPFTQNSTVGDTGDTVTTVRTTDSIAT